jgi:hypothetical protein
LCHFDLDWDVIVEMDASNYVSASILSQYYNNNILHPVAHLSKPYSLLEYNYEIYNKELIAIVQAFEE